MLGKPIWMHSYDPDYPVGAYGSDNPLTGFQGFAGLSRGYPAFGTTRIALGEMIP